MFFRREYLATAKDESQQFVKKKVYAKSPQAATEMLSAEGYKVVGIEKYQNPTMAALKEWRIELGSPASKRDLASFSNQLALMVKTKVNTATAFKILAQSTPGRRFRAIILDVRKRIMDGESISQAFASYPEAFDDVYVAIVQASETTGQLPLALQERARAIKRSDKVLRKLKNASIYPAIVLCIALIAVLVFSLLVVPAMAQLYKEAGAQLPWLTRAMIWISDIMRTNFLVPLGVLAIPVAIFSQRRAIFENHGFQRLIMRVPFLRDLTVKGCLVRILQLLSQFSTANVSMVKQLFLCQKAAGNVVFEQALARIRFAVQTTGTPLSEAFEREKAFPPVVSGNIHSGEATGNLGEVLTEMSEYYIDDLDDAVTRFTAILEPLLILVLAVLIGIMVTAMYLPLFNLAQVLNKS